MYSTDSRGLPEGNRFLDLLFGARSTFVSVADLRDQDESMGEIAQIYRSRDSRPAQPGEDKKPRDAGGFAPPASLLL
ncbi:MAG: hypothetical protein GX108_05530 [Thermovirga sp.]|nr:hypothetical protein [Thermovirga sp.]